ncbi:neurotransmitter-gated ion-channel ligand binding domain-containing protein [Ditylenchus destructor]|nr:neurotransmitter-gated ion-channel ligand binding domain-containing protein [Ditylenchus destructor]
MRDYNILERPVENHSQPVVVYLKVSLQQLIDVDEKNQIVWCNAWLDYAWNDYKLRWEISEYGNISDVRFPAGKIWKPDVLLYNSVDANFDSTYPTNMVVYHTGDISWVPPGIFKISCKIDIKWFPFDEQRCFFKFGSWSYNGFKLDLQPAKGGFDISEYLTNGEWALPMTTVSRSEKFYDCCPGEPYPDLTFYLHLRRRTLYYGFNLIMPCILTTTMSLLGFTLPPEAGEKITLQITVLLSICFFLSILSDMSPPTSEAVPLLGLFFSSCMIVTTASTVFTVYVLNLHYRTPETHEMGPTARTILLYYLPYLLRMKRPGVYLTWESLPSILPCSKPKRHSESLMRNVKDTEESGGSRASFDIEQRVNQLLLMSQSNGGCDSKFKSLRTNRTPLESVITCPKTPISADPTQQAVLLALQKIHKELKMITRRMVETDREGDQSSNWKYAAMVIDRLCLYVFTLILIGTILGVLISAPYIIA